MTLKWKNLALLNLDLFECVASLANTFELLQTISMDSNILRLTEETRKSLDEVDSKDKLDIFSKIRIYEVGEGFLAAMILRNIHV